MKNAFVLPSGQRIVVRQVPADTPPLHQHAVVHRVLAARNIQSPDELDLSLAKLPSPDTLSHIDAAVERLTQALYNDERVIIVGDYDCDGATSTAVARLGLALLGFHHIHYLIPNRFVHGYGLSPSLVEEAQTLCQPDLIITVDNGVSSVEGVAHANALGMDVVVTDHHLPGEVLPDAVAIVNPNLSESTFPSRALAGVGVLFYTLIAVRAALRKAEHPGGSANLGTLLDLVAIGTVADVVPLDAVNRVLVAQGIRRIQHKRSRPGVEALLKVAGKNAQTFCTEDIGFGIGPRLNAAGRMADMTIGVECLLSEEPVRARQLAEQLEAFNRERRTTSDDMEQSANQQLAQLQAMSALPSEADTFEAFTVCLVDDGWHQGVIGLLAGRIKETLHRPAVIFTSDEETGWLKGSARSIPGVHVRDVLQAIATEYPSMIEKFGGHAMAAGLTLSREYFDTFQQAFEAQVSQACGGHLPQREFDVDGSLAQADITLEMAKCLRSVMPWGQGFTAPLFVGEFRVIEQRQVGGSKTHLQLTLRLWNEEVASTMKAIAFNTAPVADITEPVVAVYSLDVNAFRGDESAQLRIQHIEQAALR